MTRKECKKPPSFNANTPEYLKNFNLQAFCEIKNVEADDHFNEITFDTSVIESFFKKMKWEPCPLNVVENDKNDTLLLKKESFSANKLFS